MDEEELEEIRRRKLAQLQSQAIQAEQQEEMQEKVESQKQAILRKILSPEARSRLANIKMVRPEFASQIELQMIQLAQSGQLSRLGSLPLSDAHFKMILSRLSGKKQEFRIKHI